MLKSMLISHLGSVAQSHVNMPSVVVFGGSGFIGTRLCRFLNASNYIFNIYDQKKSVLFGHLTHIVDVRESISLNIPQGYDVIINLAAEHRDDVHPKILYYQTNVLGAINVCEFARASKINKIIFTSSVSVYGFAPIGTNELGAINPYNDYGSTKWQAEEIYRQWQAEDSINRTLVIIRPTAVFGEGNRGNIYNLFKQIASGHFVMIGKGHNRKSIAYVDNVASFIEYAIRFGPGLHLFNYVDKPDLSMNELVSYVNESLGRSLKNRIRIPYALGLLIAKLFDITGTLLKKQFPVSSIRVKKFSSNSVYESSVNSTKFKAPNDLLSAIRKTIKYEFKDRDRSR